LLLSVAPPHLSSSSCH